jgi:hypothetical protein
MFKITQGMVMKHQDLLITAICATFSFCKADIDEAFMTRVTILASQFKLGVPVTITWRRLSNNVRMTAYVGDECLVRVLPRDSNSLPLHPVDTIEFTLKSFKKLIDLRDSVDIIFKTTPETIITEFK